jgi:hypothetical protein
MKGRLCERGSLSQESLAARIVPETHSRSMNYREACKSVDSGIAKHQQC